MMSTIEWLQKIVPGLEVRHELVSFFSKWMSDEQYLRFVYKQYTGMTLNLQEPVLYNEKIQWYKINYRTDLMTQCADKYRVHNYIRKCGLDAILTKQYCVFEKAADIDFSALPDECFLKCNHNSAGNYHWKKNSGVDCERLRKRFDRMLKVNQYSLSREWAYKNIEPLIICEEFLKPENGTELVDYNVFCFNGIPRFVMYNTGLCDENGGHADGSRIVLDTNFKPLGMTTGVDIIDYAKISKPDNFDDIIEYARILSKPFPHVRVDFFYFNGEIRFGELTFYSGSGFGQFKPLEWQNRVGDWFILPEKTV